MEKDFLLSLHENKIWKANDGVSWCTYINEGEKRRLIRKRDLDTLETEVAEIVKDRLIPTCEECFQMWIDEKMEYREICNGTRDRYYNDYVRFIKGSMLNDMAISEIDTYILRKFLKDSVREYELTAKAYGGLRTLIMGIFKWAKNERFTDFSITQFFNDLDMGKNSFARSPKKKQVFYESEMKRIIEYINTHKTVGRLGVLLALQTGMREGELSALRFSDIEGNVIHVRCQEVKYKSEESGKLVHEIVERTKTEAGERDIIITPKTMETIEEIRKLVPKAEFLMTNPLTNKKMWTNSYNHAIYDMCDALGMERLSMHKCRKTYATILLRKGTDETLVQNQLGHSDITTTRKYYQFCDLDHENRVEQIQNAINF